jgi:exonuclease VII small subunit
VKQCQSLLSRAEQKVDVLIKANAEGIETKTVPGES